MRAEIATFTASILINAGVLFSLDHAIIYQDLVLKAEQRELLAKRGADSMNFEFVESPPQRKPVHPPKKTRRISNRDALSRDLMRHQGSPDGIPSTKTVGHADQLKKDQASVVSPPSTASRPMTPKAPSETQKTETKQKPEPSPKDLKSQGPQTEEQITDASLVPKAERPAPRAQASQAKPSLKSMSGQDNITLSEISKSKSRGAQLYGLTSFEAAGSVMGEYMKNLKERIWMAWFPYLMVHYPKDFKTADTLVAITLSAKGEVKGVTLIENKGSALFAAFCMESVRRAGPFGPIPQEILDLSGKEELEIKFAFHYW